MTDTIHILIVDDHTVVRDGLNALLSLESGMQVVGMASDGEEAVRLARQLKPDVILMDLVMPRMDGVQATLAIRREDPRARILVLTSFAENHQVFSAIKAGAMGYVMKDTSAEELVDAIRETAQNRPVLQPDIARKLVRDIQEQPGHAAGRERPHRARDRDLAASGAGQHQPGDRRPALPQRAHRAHAHHQYPRQAGSHQPHPGCPLRPQAGHRPHRLHKERTWRGIR